MRYTLRDLCWFIFALLMLLGGFRLGEAVTTKRIDDEMWSKGLYMSSPQQVAVFRLKNADGQPVDRNVYFHLRPDPGASMTHTWHLEVRSDEDHTGRHYFLYIPEN